MTRTARLRAARDTVARMSLDRRQFLVGGAAAAALLVTRQGRAAGPSPADVKALYRRAYVIDMLGGIGAGDNDRFDDPELQRIRQSGVTAVHLTVGVEDWESTLRVIAWVQGEAARLPQHFAIARRQADLTAARSAKKLAIILGTQGSLLLGRDLERVDLLHGLGLRVFQLTYNRGDLVGDGCLEPRDGGLTRFGRDVLARLEERRIAVDLSHVGRRTCTTRSRRRSGRR